MSLRMSPASAIAALRAIAGAARAWGRDTSGATALMFAMTAVPLLIGIGAAIDYTSAATTKTKLDAAVDAAALLAVGKNELTKTTAVAQQGATAIFRAQSADIAPATVASFSAQVTENGLVRTAVMKYTATMPTTFLGVIGMTQIAIAGTATASSSLPAYIDFYLLLDNSPSMGVGATTADINTMVANTSDKCAFACHDLSDPKNYYKLAKKLNVTMRIDVLRTATQNLMDTADATASISGQFRMSVNTFGVSCTSLNTPNVVSLTSNMSSAKGQSNNIDLMTIPKQNYNNDQCTDLDGALATMNKLIPAPGDGSTAASPQKILFFVSDGVADAYYPTTCTKTTTNGRCQEPLTAANCKTIRDRGVKIAVLYTTYLPLPTNKWYNDWIAPFQSQIGTNMQACASPGLYFEVSPTQGVSEAMTALFQKAVAQARLTN
ncbi:TadE/TadG family type IV pilus assembly protein [Terrarubrum flagellatum]|uniref:TadE/TadG family type IV pilus assembly protein n=1 Tax=Terrirubrum flagellatum TaxID=2895980 RepID=UPI003144F9C5